MPYSQKIHHKKLPPHYFSNREYEEVCAKNRKSGIAIGRTCREGERYFFKTNDRTHVVGSSVFIDGEMGIVKKVSRKGVFVQKYTSNKGFWTPTTKKPVFIKENDYRKRATPNMISEEAGVMYSPANIIIQVKSFV